MWSLSTHYLLLQFTENVLYHDKYCYLDMKLHSLEKEILVILTSAVQWSLSTD